jgi:hypothetical protein
MKKLTMLTRRTFAALVLVAMFSPAVLASSLIGTYCVEINSLTRPFELATSEIGEGHYLLNGTYIDPASPNIGAVIGSASIADGAITMTLRASGIDGSAMSVSTYQFDIALNNLSGVFQSITQDSSGSILHDNGVAALVDCNSPIVGPDPIETSCTYPRPEMCAMDYAPVCGLLNNGERQSYSNGCVACIDLNVTGYIQIQECQ